MSHVRDLGEVLVQPGDPIQVGQPLARLSGYAEALNRDAELVRWELVEAEAKLADAEARLEVARRDATAAHEQQVADAGDRVAALAREAAARRRQTDIAGLRLAEAKATTQHHQRWLDTLAPLDEFDPWGDLPYLVGAQSGPSGPRSDLAYREALTQARYDLRQAELAQQIAELEAADTAAQFEQTQRDLESAQKALAHLVASDTPEEHGVEGHPCSSAPPPLCTYEASVHINELRLAKARADMEQASIKSLIAGQVLDVRIDRADGNEAVVVIRITTDR